MTTLTAAIIARDEERLIGDCLDSVSFADECLVLVDAATTDRTREVALERGARVEERAFDNFAAQRDAALALATGRWVLFVDADERVTDALRAEVLAAIRAPADVRGFWIPRDNVILGRVVRSAGWYPDYQLRLLERHATRFDPRRVVHELAIVDGELGYLRSPLVHLNYRGLGEFVRKQERYAHLEARRWLLTYGRPRSRAVLGQALREFWRRFVVLHGYREGMLGALLSALLAFYTARAVWLARRGSPQVLEGLDHADAREKVG